MTARERKSACAIHVGLSVFGDSWTLLVVRDLLRGRNTFQALSSGDEGIATNVLADRLSRLTKDGIVTKHRVPGRGHPTRYELTDKGLELLPVLIAIAEWSVKHDPPTRAIRQTVLRRKRELIKGAAAIRAGLREEKREVSR